MLGHVLQIMQQRFGPHFLFGVPDPHLWQTLVGGQFSHHAAQVLALHACHNAVVSQRIRPQRGNCEIGGLCEAQHASSSIGTGSWGIDNMRHLPSHFFCENPMPLSLIRHSDGPSRCSWCSQGDAFADYIRYHDEEWGQPVACERRLFEKITLEGFQSGLSWLTVLRKRDRFREVFADFDFEKVARFDPTDVERLVQDTGVIRHRGKIVSAINNAQRVCSLIDRHGPGALAKLVWSHEPAAKRRPEKITPELASTLSQTDESLALSKALKKLGFSFVGPTTMSAFMQSMGVVNDHLHGCHSQPQVEAARAAFVRP